MNREYFQASTAFKKSSRLILALEITSTKVPVRISLCLGTISLIGVLTGPIAQVQLPLILMQNMRIQGVTVGSREDHEAMVRAIEQNQLKPVISEVYELAQAAAAIQALPQGEHFGKIGIRF